MDATTVIAIAGIVGTLAGGLGGHYLQARLKQRGDREAKLSDTRSTLYLEAMAYAIREEVWLDNLQTPYASAPDLPEVSRAELIGARMALFSPKSVRVDWETLLTASRRLSWMVQEDMPEVAFGEDALHEDVPELIAVREAIDALRNRLRQKMDIPDD